MQHTCAGCGGSCRGVVVRLLGDEEARVRGYAAELGVDEPVVSGALRQRDGACVFLGADARCAIHGAFGAAAKPTICRQYPLVAVRTEQGARLGLDPGCYAAWRGGGEPVDTAGAVGSAVTLPEGEARAEAAVVQLLGGRLGDALGALVGERPGDTVPPRFAARLRERLAGLPWGPLLGAASAGDSLRAALAPVAAFATDPTRAPGWITPDQEAWAMDAVRRLVSLRLLHGTLPGAPVAALLGLSGVAACAWADPTPDVFGPALAGWSRALRAPGFRAALVPDAAALRWLATGQIG